QELEGARERVSGILERLRASLRNREPDMNPAGHDAPPPQPAVGPNVDGPESMTSEGPAPDVPEIPQDHWDARPDAEQGQATIEDVIDEAIDEQPRAYLKLFARQDRD